MYTEDLVLKENEKILLESPKLTIVINDKTIGAFDDGILTNKRIIGIKHKSERFAEISLEDILIVNGKLLAVHETDEHSDLDYDEEHGFHKTYNYRHRIKVGTTFGIVNLSFDDSKSKDMHYARVWISKVFETLDFPHPNNVYDAKDAKSIIKSIISSESDEISSLIKRNSKPKKSFVMSLCHNQDCCNVINTETKNILTKVYPEFCPHCGHKLFPDSKYCSQCGTLVSLQDIVIKQTVKLPEKKGSTVKELTDKLEKIEMGRYIEKKGIFDIHYEERVDEANEFADKKTLSAIRSFPVPSDINELYDFVILARDNVNFKVSKNTVLTKISNKGSYKKTLSDAWVEKLKQAYKKGMSLYPENKIFKEIQCICYDTFEKLNIDI